MRYITILSKKFEEDVLLIRAWNSNFLLRIVILHIFLSRIKLSDEKLPLTFLTSSNDLAVNWVSYFRIQKYCPLESERSRAREKRNHKFFALRIFGAHLDSRVSWASIIIKWTKRSNPFFLILLFSKKNDKVWNEKLSFILFAMMENSLIMVKVTELMPTTYLFTFGNSCCCCNLNTFLCSCWYYCYRS